MRVGLIAAGLWACAAALASAQVTSAENNPEAAGPPVAAEGWRVSVGAAAILRPEWDGARDNAWLVVPDLDVRWSDRFFASFRTGVGWNVVAADGWRVGPYAKLKFGRDEEDDAALRGLGDVDATVEVGGFVERSWRPFRISLEARQGVGGHEGLVVEAGADLRARLGPTLFASIGPRVRVADDAYLQTYFGVDAAQAARSGLPAFSPESGLESAGLAAALLYRPNDKTIVTLFGEASQLQADAKDSALVRLRGDDAQTRAGIAVGYRLGR